MTERDAAAVDVDLRGVELQLADASNRLRGKRFIELDEIDLIDCEAGAFEGFLGRRNRAEAHTARIHASDSCRNNASEWLVCGTRDQESSGAVIDPAGARRRYCPVLPERRLELCDRFERGASARVFVLRERRSVRERHRHELVGEHALLE